MHGPRGSHIFQSRTTKKCCAALWNGDLPYERSSRSEGWLGLAFYASNPREKQRARAAGAREPRFFHMADRNCRAAGNRTRSLRTRSACTTGILRPEVDEEMCKRSLCISDEVRDDGYKTTIWPAVFRPSIKAQIFLPVEGEFVLKSCPNRATIER